MNFIVDAPNISIDRIIELTNRNIVNYIGNYDYYLEKRDILTAKASPDAQLSSSDNTTKKDSKLSWQPQFFLIHSPYQGYTALQKEAHHKCFCQTEGPAAEQDNQESYP